MGIADCEKEPVALNFLQHDYQAFVLDYNTQSMGDGSRPKPVYDIAKLMYTIRLHADEWNINPDRIAIIGFSAGGHVCACLATQWQMPFLKEKIGADNEMYKPNAAILCYPYVDNVYQMSQFDNDPQINEEVQGTGMTKRQFLQAAADACAGGTDEKRYVQSSPINYITDQVPPIFMWQTSQDELVYVGHSIRFALELAEHHIPFEYHVFETGSHGLSMANISSAATPELMNEEVAKWPKLAYEFLCRHFSG